MVQKLIVTLMLIIIFQLSAMKEVYNKKHLKEIEQQAHNFENKRLKQPYLVIDEKNTKKIVFFLKEKKYIHDITREDVEKFVIEKLDTLYYIAKNMHFYTRFHKEGARKLSSKDCFDLEKNPSKYPDIAFVEIFTTSNNNSWNDSSIADEQGNMNDDE